MNCDICRRDNIVNGFFDYLCGGVGFVQGAIAVHGNMHIDKCMCTGRADANGMGIHNTRHGSRNLLDLVGQPKRGRIQQG